MAASGERDYLPELLVILLSDHNAATDRPWAKCLVLEAALCALAKRRATAFQ